MARAVTELEKRKPKAVTELKEKAIKELPPSFMRYFTPEQLQGLTPEQLTRTVQLLKENQPDRFEALKARLKELLLD